MSDEDLALHIAERSGNRGIGAIEDFEEWYDQRFEKQIEALRPVRMALVGLGADESAIRMVDYLRNQGVGITLMTFYGYQHNGQVLLARHMEDRVARDIDAPAPATRRTAKEKMDALDQLAATLGIEPLWQQTKEALRPRPTHTDKPGTNGQREGITLDKDGSRRTSPRDLLSCRHRTLLRGVHRNTKEGALPIRDAAARPRNAPRPRAMVLPAGRGRLGRAWGRVCGPR